MAIKSEALSVNIAWNAVAVEERLDILSRAQATGLMGGLGCILVMGTIGWGFDNIWILAAGVCVAFFLGPMFSSYSWRRNKPAAILAYLAARAVSRRYAYGYDCNDLDVVLIYRGEYREIFADREGEEIDRQRRGESDSDSRYKKPVWIALLKGAVVILSERRGGAKLEYYTPITDELVVRKSTDLEDPSNTSIVIEGTEIGAGRKALIDSSARGALYVFERQLSRLIESYESPYAKIQNVGQIGQ